MNVRKEREGEGVKKTRFIDKQQMNCFMCSGLTAEENITNISRKEGKGEKANGKRETLLKNNKYLEILL